jgi:hypothetical protein
MKISRPELAGMHRPPSQVTLALAAVFLPLLVGCGSREESRGLREASGSLVRINEIQASGNSEEATDVPGEFPDWIELYNAGEHAGNLAGYFITDNPERPFKHALVPGVVVPARGFLVLFADDPPHEGPLDPIGPLHLSFKLSAGGEGVYLRDPDGNLVDGIDFGAVPWSTTPYPDYPIDPTCLDPDVPCNYSYARFPDGSGAFQWCDHPSPEKSNGSECTASAGG